MQSKFKLGGLILTVFIMALVMVSCELGSKTDKNEVTLTGLVEAIAWDEDENVTSVAISTVTTAQNGKKHAEAESYWVADNKKGIELLKLIGKTIKVSGLVETDEEGHKTLTVKSYEVFDGESATYSDDDEPF